MVGLEHDGAVGRGGRLSLVLGLLLFGCVIAAPAHAQVVVSRPHVDVALVARQTSVQPGAVLEVGLWMRMEAGWHVYWRNPGDSGMAPEIQWELPAGYEAGPIRWPHPERYRLGPLVNFGYIDELLLPVRITVPADAKPGETVRLAAEVSWLICDELCLPGDAALELVLPVSADVAAVDPNWQQAFERAAAAAPRSDDAWQVTAEPTADGITLRIKGPVARWRGAAELFFYPMDRGLIPPAAAQELVLSDGQATLLLQQAEDLVKPIDHLRGVLVAAGGWDQAGQFKALQVDVAVTIGGINPPPELRIDPGATFSLAAALGFALLGGLILNVMPCVFPVLSIKILSFVSQAGGDRRAIRRHGYAFAAGVIVSFWLIAGLLLALRAAGEELGWGFQLQSPGFVAAMALLMFAMGLNLLGVFEVGTRMIGLAAKLEGAATSGVTSGGGGASGGGGGYSASFANGVLATALATPCTAPFMGPAIGYALTLQAFAALLVFSCIGIGMAAPYVLLSLLPQLLERLPKPGPWMERFKQFMAIPMFAVVAFLLVVFIELTDGGARLAMLLGLVLLSIGVWILGQRTAPRRGQGRGRAAKVVLGSATVVACAMLVSSVSASLDDALPWEPYSAARIEQLQAEGRPIFVDFTAAWCAICKVNELGALSSERIAAKFQEKNVALLKADWTRRDPAITRALEAFNRSGVPLYLYYPPGSGTVRVLPTILTEAIILDAIDELRDVAGQE